MPTFVLFKLVDSPDPSDPMTYGKGCPIQVSDRNMYVGAQKLPIFGQIEITDAKVGEVRDAYKVPWNKALDWDILDSDQATDTHQIKAYVKPEYVSASGMGRLTLDKVEQFLARWGATIDNAALGEVTFTANAFNAIKSPGFWERDAVTQFQWTEVAYDAVTGVHRVKVNYSGFDIILAEYAGKIVNRGCDVVANRPAQKTVTFDCSRANVFQEFKQSVKQSFDGQFAINKWRLDQAGIDAVIAAGGQLQMTKAKARAYLKNRLDD